MDSATLGTIKELIAPVIEGEGFDLVDIELSGATLRLFIEKSDGTLNVGDCAEISSQVGLLLEAENVIDNRYTLEVSSPGLTRPLKKPLDFVGAVGKLALLKLRNPVCGENKPVVIIENAGEEKVSVIIKATGEKADIEYSNISKANLEIEF